MAISDHAQKSQTPAGAGTGTTGTGADAEDEAADIFARLSERPAELLRFATAGSVDDGKSTLIGRLLYDSKQVLGGSARARRADEQEDGLGLPRPVAADRRVARRA